MEGRHELGFRIYFFSSDIKCWQQKLPVRNSDSQIVQHKYSHYITKGDAYDPQYPPSSSQPAYSSSDQ